MSRRGHTLSMTSQGNDKSLTGRTNVLFATGRNYRFSLQLQQHKALQNECYYYYFSVLPLPLNKVLVVVLEFSLLSYT